MKLLALLLISALPQLAQLARADDGHNHDAAPAASGPALPRFAASSELFELVGVLNGTQLTLYLDHAASNAPVKDAKLELEMSGVKLDVKPHGEGEFEATLALAPQPGLIPITATVSTATDSDLLAGELDLHEAVHADTTAAPRWPRYAAWGGGAAAALLVLGALARLAARRSAQSSGAVA